MQTLTNNPVLIKEDYTLLKSFITAAGQSQSFDRKNIENLLEELKRATIINKEDFSPDIIRIDSTVRIRDNKTGNIRELKLVLPEKANILQSKISILAPLGTALLGYRKGQEFSWDMPAGRKTFLILEVINEE
jgi:regulator of nucleoside diphosphate kinase